MALPPAPPFSKTRDATGLLFLSGELPLADVVSVTACLVDPADFAALPEPRP